MAELPRPSYAVNVLGACEHRWPGTVYVLLGSAGPGRFVLDQDDKTCPECGGNASTVLFGADFGAPGDG